MFTRSSLLATFCFLFAAAGLASAQQIHLPPSISQSQSMGAPPVTTSSDVERQQALAASQQRQIEIKRDTDKMAELTMELKDYLAKGSTATMSLDAIKKAEQIEKLAKSVKSKLKQSL